MLRNCEGLLVLLKLLPGVALGVLLNVGLALPMLVGKGKGGGGLREEGKKKMNVEHGPEERLTGEEGRTGKGKKGGWRTHYCTDTRRDGQRGGRTRLEGPTFSGSRRRVRYFFFSFFSSRGVRRPSPPQEWPAVGAAVQEDARAGSSRRNAPIENRQRLSTGEHQYQ